jgi:O-antigen ligase
MTVASRFDIAQLRNVAKNLALFLFLLLPFVYISRDSYQKLMDGFLIILLVLNVGVYINFYRIRQSKSFISAFFFISYLYVASLWVENSRLDEDDTFKILFSMLAFLLVFFSDFSLDRKKFVFFLYGVVIVAGCYAGINFFLEYKYPEIVSYDKGVNELVLRRLVGYGPLTRNPIFVAAVMSMYLYIGIAILYTQSWIHKKKFLIPIICAMSLIAVFIYFTGSRSTYLAFIVAVTVVLAKSIERRYLLLFSIIFITALLLNIEYILLRGLSFRPELWSDSFQLAMHRPVIGHGYAEKITLFLDNGMKFNNSHNMYLAIFYYGGLVGLSLFLAIYFFVVKSIFSTPRDMFGVFARLLLVHCLIVMMFTPFGIVHRFSEMYYYVLLPIGLAIYIELSKKPLVRTVAD